MDVYRIIDFSTSQCWYGFIYESNESGFDLKENIKPSLEGLEIYGRKECNLVMSPQEDEIIILRRTKGDVNCQISYSTLPRDLTEAEMIIKARDGNKGTIGDDICYWKFTSLAGSVYYFKNESQEQSYKITLNFTLTNLYIKGKNQDESSIDLVLNYGSGSNCVFLKPVVSGECTGIKLGMSAI